MCSNHCTMSKKALRAMQKKHFVAVCNMFRSLQNIAKTVVLLHEELFCDACLRKPKNIVPCVFEGSKTCFRPFKIESGATQSLKKTTNMGQKSARSVQEPAKSEKKRPRAKNVPTWAQLDGVSTSVVEGPGPPLRKDKQYVNASIKCSGV